ncbi:hypothetical protein BDN72DRAFT_806673 [Pluteus cervinus]|uniref:Uncharacterized protein n=1 Tax=Pluteus cervinus TaxID=181527 RepID=A0ACD3BGB5_9AGAR|nr:hypothetical protein BDN72DRAFT_806673 [Pluteus cervinus]
MVYVNSKKFACESCIKGHRSSSCHHTDRPLFEIKKKGRPVSQCEKCRELRQSKRVHSKCTCLPKDDSSLRTPLASSSSSKSKRYIPVVPALPNGLKDVLQSSAEPTASNARQRVDSLLNPCHCNNVWKCKCKGVQPPYLSQPSQGLAALARAAAAISTIRATSASSSSSSSSYQPVAGPSTRAAAPKRIPSRPNSPRIGNKRAKLDNNLNNPLPSPGPHLPPILMADDQPSLALNSVPEFPVMPPISTLSSFAGSGCTCGFHCACPGCVEHRGRANAAGDRNDCGEGCGNCVDDQLRVLPGHGGQGKEDSFINSANANTLLDEFFARAAALPLPPANRRMGGGGVDLDPTNSIVYPEIVRDRDAGECAVAFGLITVPKLECCRGNCGCPPAGCSCNSACDGCCADQYGDNLDRRTSRLSPQPPASPTAMEVDSGILPLVQSCCTNKEIIG